MNQNQENQNEIQLLSNQRLCPKCNSVVSHVNDSQCRLAMIEKRQCKSCHHNNKSLNTKSYNLQRLLNDELESFYWIGFLIADGWFSVDKQRFSLEVGEQDYDHLIKFSNYLSFNNKIRSRNHVGKGGITKSFKLKVCNNLLVPQIIDKFKIKPRKSYNPIDFSNFENNFTENQILSLIAGFSDGDGSFIQHNMKSNRVIFQIGIHESWIGFLEFIKTYISSQSTIILNKKMSILRLCNHIELKIFKANILKLNLPILSRKWDRINLDEIKAAERSKQRINATIQMFINGKDEFEISQTLGIHKRTVQKYLKRYDIKK